MQILKAREDVTILGFSNKNSYLQFVRLYKPAIDTRVYMGKTADVTDEQAKLWLETKFMFKDPKSEHIVIQRFVPNVPAAFIKKTEYRNYSGTLDELFILEMSGKDKIYLESVTDSFKTAMNKINNPEFIIVLK